MDLSEEIDFGTSGLLGCFYIYTRMMKGRSPNTREIPRVIFSVTLPPTDTSLLENEKMGHDSAMSDNMRKVIPCGCHMVKGVAIGQ
jgi:hypothetical protein